MSYTLNKDFQRELFENELKVLKQAEACIADEKYRDNELLPKYEYLAADYSKLLNLTSKAFKISDTQGMDLKRRESEIKSLLDNSNQGFLTFGKDLFVDREYSQECIRIFGGRIANCSILELLCGSNAKQNEIFANVFQSVFETGDMDLRLSYISKLPNFIKINDKYVNIKYKIISGNELALEDDIIMLVLTDITEKRKTEDLVLYLSLHDKLTSLYNRAYIDTIIPQLEDSSNLPLSVIMADMNGLKLTNDVFGHESGDKLLVKLSNILVKCCRKSDIVARWGGDEFLIILPGANSHVCEKVCSRIKNLCIEGEPDPIELSVSLGWATTEGSNARISELFGIAENIMYSSKVTESKDIRKKIVLSMEKILHTRCLESYGHVERIKNSVLNLAKCIKPAPSSIEMANLPLLSTLHDIGKVAIPREILAKKGPLTDNERKIMQNHTQIGFRMAQSIEEPVLAQAILAMRERWDGKGYPYGLKAEQIPLISRIVAIVDAYDVMTHDRPYKKKMSKDEAVAELEKCGGQQFDPGLVRLFIDKLESII